MLATKDETLEMKSEDINNQEELFQENEVSSEEESTSHENALSEINEPIWSVVNFEQVLEDGLTYDEAVQKMKEAMEQKISGLCIITDEAAQRLSS